MVWLKLWWFWTLLWLLTVVTLLANGLIAYLIITRRRLHTTANRFVLSLALAYFCVGLTYFPTRLPCELWVSCDPVTDAVLSAIRWFFVDVSIMNLCAVVFDRYIAIVKPLKYLAWVTNARAHALLCIAWIIQIPVPLVTYFGRIKLPPIYFHEIAGAFLILATGHVLVITRRHAKTLSTLAVQLSFNSKTQEMKMSFRRNFPGISSIKIVFILVVSYLLCYGFDITIYYYNNNHQSEALPQFIYVLHALLLMENSTVNLLAYSFYKNDIKKEIKRCLGIRSCGTSG